MHATRVASTVGLPKADWLAIRRTGIGSSDAAAILGLNPWRSPLQVWLDKTGMAAETPQNDAMRLGNWLEDPIARAWAERRGVKVRRVRAILQHPTMPFALANLDRVATVERKTGPVEVKATRLADQWDNGTAPDLYVVQVQHQLLVTGYDAGYLVALVQSTTLEERRIERDPALLEVLVEAEAAFWELVKNGTPPAPTGTEGDRRALEALYAKATDKQVEITDEALKAARDYLQASARVKEWESAKEEAGNRLRAFLGQAEAGTYGGKVAVRWSPYTRKLVDIDRLKAEEPEIAARFETEQVGRRLSIVGKVVGVDG